MWFTYLGLEGQQLKHIFDDTITRNKLSVPETSLCIYYFIYLNEILRRKIQDIVLSISIRITFTMTVHFSTENR